MDVLHSNNEQRGTGLVRELLRSHRLMLQMLALMLVVAGSSMGYTLLVSQPNHEHHVGLAHDARSSRIAVLE